MTIAQAFLDSIYTGKDGQLTAYNIGKLEVLKPCFIRYNKGSKNGIALTVCDAVSTNYNSRVSKSGAEKGIKPVEIEAGDTILFNINATTERDGKPSDEAKIIATIINLLEIKGVKEGEIILATCDFGSIPPIGLDAEDIEYLERKKPPSKMLVVSKFENEEELGKICEEHGLNVDQWMDRYTLLSGTEFKEQQAYSRKGYKDMFEERLTYFETIAPEVKTRLMTITKSIYGSDDGTDTISEIDFGSFVRDCLVNI